MTETLTNAEAKPSEIGGLLEQWVADPPASVSEALAERGLTAEALEEYARSGISSDDVENLRKVLVHSATSGNPDDAGLLHRLQPALDPRERAWDRVIRAKNTGEVLSAVVTEATKGGLVVDLGVRGFIPSSQVGLSQPRNLQQYVGQTLRMRVLEINRNRQTVILSNRVVKEEERQSRRKDAIERLQEGEVRQGTVRRLTDIGAFVDVGGVDGLLHVSEISWKRIEHPSDVLKVGQKIQVKVLRVDPDSQRVSLSVRRLMNDPWEEARRKYAIGTVMKVKIAGTVPQGAVVELTEDGLEGFIPISELAPRRVTTAEEVVQPGQEVDAAVIDLRPRERRIVFSIRKMEQKRERQIVDNYQKTIRRTSDRTTLGDLFGHLFEEYQQEPEEEAAAADETASTEQAEVGTVEAVEVAEAAEPAEGEAVDEGTGEAVAEVVGEEAGVGAEEPGDEAEVAAESTVDAEPVAATEEEAGDTGVAVSEEER